MTATHGAMTDLSSVSSFLSTSSEEPELESISFHESLRFFKEQLNLNGNSFPSPSTSSMDITGKYSVDFTGMENRNDRLSFDARNMSFEEDSKSLNSCRISIPTVDSILESVRVLRAIQKTQEQRGSSWSLSKVLSSVDQNIQQSASFREIRNKISSAVASESSNLVDGAAFCVGEKLDSKNIWDSQINVTNGEPKINAAKDKNHETTPFWPRNNIEKRNNEENGTALQSLISENGANVYREKSDIINLSSFGSQQSSVYSNGISKKTTNPVEGFGITQNVTDCIASVTEVKNHLLFSSSSKQVLDSSAYCDKHSAHPKHAFEDETEAEHSPIECTSDWWKHNQNTTIDDVETHEYPSTSPTPIITHAQEDGSDFDEPEEIIVRYQTSGVLSDIEEETYDSKHSRTNQSTEDIREISADEDFYSTSSTCASPSSPDFNITDKKELSRNILNSIANHVNNQNHHSGPVEIVGSETDCESSSTADSAKLFSSESQIDLNLNRQTNKADADDVIEIVGKKFITSSWDLVSIVKLLYKIKEPQPPQVFPEDTTIERRVFILSKGSFTGYCEGYYSILLEDSSLYVLQNSEKFLSISLKHADVHIENENTLKLDNKMGRCLYMKCDTQEDLLRLKDELQLYCMKFWQSECINLVHYPLKCHKNIVVIDLGSCSVRAGILMDQPTLPTIFFPSVCATNKTTGKIVYGKDALKPEARQNSTISFPLRPSVKIVKHNIEVDQVRGIFKKIFRDLKIDPWNYTVQVCLPRSLSISAQNSLVKVLLEDLNVQAVSLAHQAILTLYAHGVSTGIVVDVGDRMDILPVIDGFIVESGVTRLPHGGQRLIHHMKHALAEKHISLSNDIDSFVVQYITESLSYIAEDYDKETDIAALNPDAVRKSVDLQSFANDGKCLQQATLEDARFQVPEGLFNPDLWGLDSPGIHKLVQKAIQAASVDARKRIAENIYVSGGVTLTPGFVERLTKEVTRLNAPRIVPKVFASNYRYHCTFIGACKFARMDVFSQVCVSKEEYGRDQISSLKKFMLCV